VGRCRQNGTDHVMGLESLWEGLRPGRTFASRSARPEAVNTWGSREWSVPMSCVIPVSRVLAWFGVCAVLSLGCSRSRVLPPPAETVVPSAPGAPGGAVGWEPGDKDGFGTAVQRTSKVWFTLRHGKLSDVYYPTVDVPSVHDLQFVVSDGTTFAEREEDATEHRVVQLDARSLMYQQVNTDKALRYRLTKTYVTDPDRDTLVMEVTFESLTGKPYAVYVLHDPSLSNDGRDDSATSRNDALVASDDQSATVLLATPPLTETSSGYLGTSDGWTELQRNRRLIQRQVYAPRGNVVQVARLAVEGLSQRKVTLVLGFGPTEAAATGNARATLAEGYDFVAQRYAKGWHDYLDSLPPVPKNAEKWQALYSTSVMVLAAAEDKTQRGAFIAAPAMPWLFGHDEVSGPYHLVWSRDLYQIATGLLAAGDRAAASRALDHLFQVQQKPDGSFPQNAQVDGTPKWGSLQLDEVALPLVLAWQLGRTDAETFAHVRRAADFLVVHGPESPQERWENQSGFSPSTIAAEIAGLICAADLARKNGDGLSASKYETTADAWQRQLETWTVTHSGPLSSKPYYLRLTKDGHPETGTPYSIGDGGPETVDQRQVVDMGFLELVRLGVKPAADPIIAASIEVGDAQLKIDTPEGPLWHRFSFDGYGEKSDGSAWEVTPPNTLETRGRLWPLLAGERGEYELAAGRPATAQLATLAGAASEGYLLPEQVWDDKPPAGAAGFRTGGATTSARPLLWTHAQFVRLAWSHQEGFPVEQPSIVACRYAHVCR